ncbi:hypothetical protein RTG_01238 [Rhodotorula toruloides ATCC 204091]|uniref:Uncharacterized protein n=1 Tax=Rhodotorula toruloides TaxID=5286 RepID=A0A0K3CBX6_RHOTO|nr:hypothetical protein RTG_01238 [Rhodotorula toruloides ATCC 204091]KAK4331487.1 hypothetical protein RTBOTA2_000938 [Rhodotorula toruloides]PRQ77873.1 hypothetical protein AAT19DRAFT_8941 [Rhodotorula toruloides]
MHGRTTSNSYRIAVAPSSPTGPARTPTRTPRRRPSATSSQSGRGLAGRAHDAASWLVGGAGRTGVRRWMVLAGLSFGAVVLFSAGSAPAGVSLPSPSRGWSVLDWRKGDDAALLDNPDVPPVVDRSALEKLRLLEIHYGADEEAEPAYDGNDNRQAERYRARTKPNLDKPPLVVEIPEYVKPDPTAPVPPQRVQSDVLDEEVCGANGGRPCQFLVPAWLGEQETKAQQHLYQLGLLALALNRTLVLPNVSKSRLGTCYRNPFSFYYSPTSLSDLGIATISQEDFIAWTLRRDLPPSAQVVTMANAKATYTSGAVEIDSASDPTLVPSKPNRNLCLRAPRTRLDFAGHSPLAIYPPEGYHRNEASRLAFGESVVRTLQSAEVAARASRASSSREADGHALADVLTFNYELRFPMLSPSVAATFASSDSIAEPLPFEHFPYAETWSSLAAFLASRLSPFVAIHWRTETLSPSNLTPCASSLVTKLVALKRQYPQLRNVYLATDYPIEALDPAAFGETEAAHSGTFAKVVTPQHHAAMRRFLKDSRAKLKGEMELRLTTFSKEQAELQAEMDEAGGGLEAVLPPLLATQLSNLTSSDSDEPSSTFLALDALDSGLLGILDKLIAMRAQLFLTGVPGVGSSTAGACAKLSSFTNQLVQAREKVRGETEEEDGGEDGLWNTVAHFSLSGEEVD